MVRLNGLVASIAAILSLSRPVLSKAVFAHYMIGSITAEHAQKDIDDAMAMGLDGFAINVGDATKDFVPKTLGYLFSHAEAKGFKLYISMDVYASGDSCYNGGDSCNGPFDYQWIWDAHKGSSAYYQVNGKALISTFSSGGFHNDTWIKWKEGLANDMYFMPDFDETEGYYDAADGWWAYWGPIVDGIFSWESAWPERGGFGGKTPGDVTVDVPVIEGAHKRNKMYMMGLSPLQYKNSYGANVYRPGDLNMPKRMVNILAMDPQPDFVQFQTWNDGPESHYMGTIWPEQNTDFQPSFYASEDTWPHEGWQPLVSAFIKAYKSGATMMSVSPADGSVAVGAAWYRTILSDVSCPYDGESKYYSKPEGWDDGANYLYWSVILSPDAPYGYKVTVSGTEEHEQVLHAGLNYGYGAGDVKVGAQRVTLKDPSGNVIMTAAGGMCVTATCPSMIYNSNYQVLPFVEGEKEATCKKWPSLGDGEDCDNFSCASTGTPTDGDNWTKVTCENPGVTDASKDPAFRWNSVFTWEAWDWVIDQWKNGENDGDLKFVAQVSNKFHGPEDKACEILQNSNPCATVVQCDDVTHPGAYLILNSLGTIYRFMFNFWDSMDRAQNDVNLDIAAMSSTFAPIPKESIDIKLALDILGLGFALAASPMWNSALKGMAYFKKNPNELGTYKDWLNPSVSNSITIAKDAMGTDSRLGIQNELTERLKTIVDAWQGMIETMNSHLFNGSTSSVDELYDAIKDGRLLESGHTDLALPEIQNLVERALFAMMIPYSWTLSESNLGPVIINSGQGCGETEMTLIDDEDKAKMGVCVDDTMYYLAGAIGAYQDCNVGDGGGTACYANSFSVLPGMDQLDGKNWGGITKEDLVTGAVNGWKSNNEENGWDILNPTEFVDAMDLVDTLGIRAPGVVQIPVCDQWEAQENWSDQVYPDEKTKSKHYPCN